jgi:glutathione S-transferase
MRIYETRRAPNPRRVRIFLAEKGLELEFEELDLMDGALTSPEFGRLNPWRRVPVLVLDDGTSIAESVAICRYFEELHPDPPLFGRGALERAVVEMWNRRVELGLFYHVTQVFRHLNPKMAEREVPQIAAWGEANKPKVADHLALLDRRLGESRYLAGDAYSIADITALVAVDFMKPARPEHPGHLPHLARWHGEVASRPSAKA